MFLYTILPYMLLTLEARYCGKFTELQMILQRKQTPLINTKISVAFLETKFFCHTRTVLGSGRLFTILTEIYLQVSELHFLVTANIAAAHCERQDFPLGKVIWKKLVLRQHFIVNWTFLPRVPARKINKLWFCSALLILNWDHHGSLRCTLLLFLFDKIHNTKMSL